MTPDSPPVALPPVSSPETVAAHEDSERKWRRYQKAKYFAAGFGAFLGVVVAVAMVVLVAVVIGQNEKILGLTKQVVGLTSETHDTSRATQQAVQILIDCTTPGHHCYEQGQQSTRTAVQGLNAAANAREICANDLANDTVEKLEACMVDKLAHR